jgi:hypothetical protein
MRMQTEECFAQARPTKAGSGATAHQLFLNPFTSGPDLHKGPLSCLPTHPCLRLPLTDIVRQTRTLFGPPLDPHIHHSAIVTRYASRFTIHLGHLPSRPQWPCRALLASSAGDEYNITSDKLCHFLAFPSPSALGWDGPRNYVQ